MVSGTITIDKTVFLYVTEESEVYLRGLKAYAHGEDPTPYIDELQHMIDDKNDADLSYVMYSFTSSQSVSAVHWIWRCVDGQWKTYAVGPNKIENVDPGSIESIESMLREKYFAGH